MNGVEMSYVEWRTDLVQSAVFIEDSQKSELPKSQSPVAYTVAGWWGKGMEGKGHKGGASAQKFAE